MDVLFEAKLKPSFPTKGGQDDRRPRDPPPLPRLRFRFLPAGRLPAHGLSALRAALRPGRP